MKHKFLTIIGSIAVTGLLLTGCAAEDGPAGSTNDPGSGTSDSSTDTDKGTDNGTDSASTDTKADAEDKADGGTDSNAADAASASKGAAGGAKCLIGSWASPQDQLQNFYDDVESEGVSFSVEGDVGLTFTADEYDFDPDFSLLINMSGIEAEGEISGVTGGTYTATDEILSTQHETTNSLNLTVTVMGQSVDGSAIGEGFLNMYSFNEVPYTCSGDKLTLMYQDGSGNPTIPVDYMRR